MADSFQFDMTTDFGRIEAIVQEQISLNRA